MPYRVHIPDGEDALQHILTQVGTPQLVQAHQSMFNLMYNAPEATLTPREREAMRYPLTVTIGCPTCSSLRLWRDWPGFCDEPIAEEFYENAADGNSGWPDFTPRESLLVEFVHRFPEAGDDLNGDQDFWTKMNAHFTDAEIGDAVIMAGVWLGSGRGLRTLGIGSVCAMEQATAWRGDASRMINS